MLSNRCLKSAAVFLLALLPLLATGCKKGGPSGKYADSSGIMTLDFASGKATMTVMGQTKTGDYTVDGNKITVKMTDGGKTESVDMTYDPKDETISGPQGMTLKKK